MIDEDRIKGTDKLRLRIKGVSYVKASKAMGCTRANTFKLWQKLKNPKEYLYLNTINRVNKALDELQIPRGE